jgi:hypothetical protein
VRPRIQRGHRTVENACDFENLMIVFLLSWGSGENAGSNPMLLLTGADPSSPRAQFAC